MCGHHAHVHPYIIKPISCTRVYAQMYVRYVPQNNVPVNLNPDFPSVRLIEVAYNIKTK